MNQPRVPVSQIEYGRLLADFGAKNLPPGGEFVLASLLKKMSARCPQPSVVVDVGCNTGWVTTELARTFPNSQVFGFDIDPRMIHACARRLDGMDDPPTNVCFKVVDCSQLPDVIPRADLVFCAGSTAFFSDPGAVFSAIAELLGKVGVFVDVNYIYTATPPAALLAEQRQLYGVTVPAYSHVEWLKAYADAGLLLENYARHARFTLEDHEHAATYRELLSSMPGMAKFTVELVRRRTLSNDLAQFHYPAEFWLTQVNSNGAAAVPVESESLLAASKTLMLFRSVVPRLALEHIQRLNPYEFLAYVGDPDSAPGGASNVKAAATALQKLGMLETAVVLDIGCFTGLSTLVLGSFFPQVVGIDISAESVQIARAVAHRLNVSATFEVGDARALARPAGSVEAIVMTATLGYSPTPELLVREARRLLRCNGLFVEFLYDYPEASDELVQEVRDRVSADIRLSTLQDQIEWIENQGFQCVLAERSELIVDLQVSERMLEFVYDLEVVENLLLGESDRAVFKELLGWYAGELEHALHDPRAYLCVFRVGGEVDKGDSEGADGLGE